MTSAAVRRAEALGRKLAREHSENIGRMFTHNRHQKKCRLCETMKVLATFPKRASNKDGYDTRCRDCVNAYRRTLRKR